MTATGAKKRNQFVFHMVKVGFVPEDQMTRAKTRNQFVYHSSFDQNVPSPPSSNKLALQILAPAAA